VSRRDTLPSARPFKGGSVAKVHARVPSGTTDNRLAPCCALAFARGSLFSRPCRDCPMGRPRIPALKGWAESSLSLRDVPGGPNVQISQHVSRRFGQESLAPKGQSSQNTVQKIEKSDRIQRQESRRRSGTERSGTERRAPCPRLVRTSSSESERAAWGG